MAVHVRHPILLAPRRGSRAPGPSACSSSSSWWRGPARHRAAADRLRALRQQGDGQPRLHRGLAGRALGFTFAIPMLVRRLSRRWAYTLGCALLGLYAAAARARRPAGACRRHALPHRRGGGAQRHAQPLHHGQHRQARAHPLRAAAPRRRDARLGGRALSRRAADAVGRPLGAGGAEPRRGGAARRALLGAAPGRGRADPRRRAARRRCATARGGAALRGASRGCASPGRSPSPARRSGPPSSSTCRS